ncbi:MAG: hypothetical protein R2798_02530 [Chitinophagales bacterium]|nr:hypothetical protein [Bacteroidota bacterium]MCB9042205.1 hypothetical protein [Chitinophagales bacterium]
MKTYFFHFLAVVFLLTLNLTACKKAANSPFEEDAKTLAKAFKDKDAQTINDFLDYNRLIAQVTQDVDAPADYAKDFAQNFEQTFNVGEILTNPMYGERQYDFVHMKNDSVAFFREENNEGLNYVEFTFGKNADQKTVLRNFYSYMSGESFTDNLRRMYIMRLADEIDTFSNPYTDAIPQVMEVVKVAQNGDYKTAYNMLDSLPEVLQTDRMAMLMRLNLGHAIDPATEADAMAAMRKKLGDDWMIDFKNMQMHLADSTLNTALKGIDDFDKKIGGDPYLNLMRSIVYQEHKDTTKALEYSLKTLKSLPDNKIASIQTVAIYLGQNNFDKAAELFQQYKTKFDENLADIFAPTTYPEFYASEVGKKWLEENPTQMPSLPDDYNLEELLRSLNADSLMQEEAHDHSDPNHQH